MLSKYNSLFKRKLIKLKMITCKLKASVASKAQNVFMNVIFRM